MTPQPFILALQDLREEQRRHAERVDQLVEYVAELVRRVEQLEQERKQ